MCVALLALAAAPAAQAQVSPGLQATLQTAATVCIEWLRGNVDFTETAPPGFRTPTTGERLGFTVGAGESADDFDAIWVDEAGPMARWIIHYDDGCMVYNFSAQAPEDMAELSGAFDVAMRAVDPELGALAHVEDVEDEDLRTSFYDLGPDAELLVGFIYAWRDGKPVRGNFGVLTELW